LRVCPVFVLANRTGVAFARRRGDNAGVTWLAHTVGGQRASVVAATLTASAALTEDSSGRLVGTLGAGGHAGRHLVGPDHAAGAPVRVLSDVAAVTGGALAVRQLHARIFECRGVISAGGASCGAVAGFPAPGRTHRALARQSCDWAGETR
jgi:hypothetical protein